jgi:hypothetical protein
MMIDLAERSLQGRERTYFTPKPATSEKIAGSKNVSDQAAKQVNQ